MIIDNFLKGIDLIVDESRINDCEHMIRVILAKKGNNEQTSEFVIIVEGEYKLYIENKEEWVG